MPPASYIQLVKKGVVEEISPLNEYLDNIISVIDMDAIRSRDFRVAIDPMYGVSLTALSTILSVAGTDQLPFHGRGTVSQTGQTAFRYYLSGSSFPLQVQMGSAGRYRRFPTCFRRKQNTYPSANRRFSERTNKFSSEI